MNAMSRDSATSLVQRLRVARRQGRQRLVACAAAGLVAAGPAAAAPILGWTSQLAMQTEFRTLSLPSIAAGRTVWTTQNSNLAAPGLYERSLNGAVMQLVAGDAGLRFGGLPGVLPSAQATVDEVGGVSFLAEQNGPGGWTPVLMSYDNGSVSTTVTQGSTGLRGGSNVVTAVAPPSRSLGVVAFSGQQGAPVGAGQAALMLSDGGTTWAELAVGAVTPTTLTPLTANGYVGHFTSFGLHADIDWNERRTSWGIDMAFLGNSSFVRGSNTVLSDGIFVLEGMNTVRVAAERFMALPGGQPGELFRSFGCSPALSDGQVVFSASGDQGTQGVYRSSALGQPEVIADNHMLAPGGMGHFTSFGCWASVSGDGVAFTAQTEFGGEAVFYAHGGSITTVFDMLDFLQLYPGGMYDGVEIGIDALSGNQVAFYLAGGDSTRLYDRILVSTAVTPEPSALALAATALAGLLLSRRRARRAVRLAAQPAAAPR